MRKKTKKTVKLTSKNLQIAINALKYSFYTEFAFDYQHNIEGPNKVVITKIGHGFTM